ncbi:WSC domain-containing protein, partial [Lasiosphaeria ovina]
YVGCFSDTRGLRSLTGRVTYDDSLTVARCAAECAGYALFGLEYGTQCYCGTGLAHGAQRRPEHECAQRCGGDYGGAVCGDADRLSVYHLPSDSSPSPSHTEAYVGGGHHRDRDRDRDRDRVAGYRFKACWTDSTAVRSLGGNHGAVLRDDAMTAELCAKFCCGYRYMGLEFGSQCFCGNHLAAGHAVPRAECAELCYGDKREWCGGPDRLSLYE